MKVLIIGMGNVGLMHGWVLSDGGVDITHVVRKGSLAKHSGDIRMDVMDMRKGSPDCYPAVYRPKVVDTVTPSDDYDLVIVATNHLQAVEAVRQYKDALPTSDFLIFCANWSGPAEIDALLPRDRYLWGYSVFSGANGNDGTLYANIQKIFRIGALPGSPEELLQKVIETFSKAGIMPEIKENIIEWLWVHMAIVAGIMGEALAEGRMPGSQTPLDEWIFTLRAVKDALKVLEKRGVDYRKYPDVRVFMMENDEEAAQVLRQGILSSPHYERTRKHSHLDTHPEEMKDVYRIVFETGLDLGVDMPYLASLKDRILR